MATVAFPAMGTGNLGYPRDVVAEEMCNVVVDFSKENSNTCLKKVLFVVYEKDLQTIQVKQSANLKVIKLLISFATLKIEKCIFIAILLIAHMS